MTGTRVLLALLALAALGVGGWLLSGGAKTDTALGPAGQADDGAPGAPVTDRVPLIPVDGGPSRTPGGEDESSLDEPLASDGHLRALLVDRATDEPVPYYELVLEREGPGNRTYVLQSDAQGRFESTTAAEPGEYAVTLVDHPLHFQRRPGEAFVHPGDRYAIGVGPTFRVETELPPTYYPEHFRLRLSTPQSRFTALSEPTIAVVRDNDGYWARFHPLEGVSELGRWGLVLESTDDWWRSGEVTLEPVTGIRPEPIAFTLHNIGNLTVGVRTTGKRFVHEGTYALAPAPGVTVPAIAFQTSGDLSHGRIQFVGAPAGDWTLRIDSPRHEPWSDTVTVVGGESKEQDVELELMQIAGDVTGIVTSDTGRHTETLELRLTDADDPRRRFQARARWAEEEGRIVGRFRFKEIPIGRYELTPKTRNWWRWEPTSVDVAPPMDGIELVCRDAAGTTGVGFTVYDAETKEKLTGFTIDLRNDTGSVLRVSLVPSDLVFLRELPTNADAQWTIELDGYAPASGTSEDFDERRSGMNGEALFADVYLEKVDE